MKRRTNPASTPALTDFLIRTHYSPRDQAVWDQIRTWQGQRLISVQPIDKRCVWIEITDKGKATLMWSPGKIIRAVVGGEPIEANGYVYRGLALLHDGWGLPRTRTLWTLMHIGSGADLHNFAGDVATIFPVAGEIAEAIDWTLFDMPDGWKQTDPSMPEKFAAIIAAHPESNPSPCEGPHATPEDARAVIDLREGAA
jgi:hypothetical protein